MAGINRYDVAQPAKDNYFNTFVPLPLDQLTALGMSRQEELKRNQALLDKAYDDALDIKYIKESPYEEANYRSITKGVTDLAMKYAKVDLTNPLELSNLRRELRSTADPTLIKRMEESYANDQQYKALEADMRSKGTWNDKLNRNPNRSHNSQTGVFSALPEAYLGRERLLAPYMDKIHPTFKGIEVKNGMPFMIHGVRDEDINKVANERAAELISTPAGQQEIRLFKMDYPNDAAGKSDVEIMNQIMRDYGQRYEEANPLSSEMYKMWASQQQSPESPAQELYGTRGANTEDQFKSEAKLNKRIADLEATGAPDKMTTAFDLKMGKSKAIEEASSKNQKRVDLVKDMKNELWASGKFSDPIVLNKLVDLVSKYTRSTLSNTGSLTNMKNRNRVIEAQDFTPDQLKDIEKLSMALDANEAGNFIKKAFNPTSGLYKQFKKILDTPAVVAAVIDKVWDKYGEYEDTSLRDLIQQNKESLGTENIPSKYSDIPGVAKNNTFSIINKYVDKIARAEQEDSKNIASAVLQETSRTVSPSYSYNLPYSSSGNLDVRVDQSTGEKLGVFNPTMISNDVLASPSNYEIIAVDGDESMKQSKKDEAIKMMNTKDIQNIRVDILPDSKYQYNPVVEFIYNNVKDGVSNRHSLKLVLNNQSNKDAFANILEQNGDLRTATAIRQPDIAAIISTENFEPGKKVTYTLIDRSMTKEAKIEISRNEEDPTQFDITVPASVDSTGKFTYKTITAPSRPELTAILYDITGKNNMKFIKE